MVKSICEQCNKEFNRNGRWCSKECRFPNYGNLLIKNCKHCGVEFKQKVRKSNLLIFCSKECVYKGKKPALIKNPVVVKNCAWCNKEFSMTFIQRNHKHTCSRSCATKLGMSKVDRKEFGKKISKSRIEGLKSGRIIPNMLGKLHSEETKNKIGKKAKVRLANPENNGMFGQKHKASSKDAMSKTKAKRFVQGKYDKSKYGKSGYGTYKKAGRVFFRSSWEKKAFEMLDTDNNVESFVVEPFSIPYFRKEGNRKNLRNYVPDILVTYTDGSKKLVEVKPACYLEAVINIAKFTAAREKCLNEGWAFEVWTQKELSL